MLGATVYAYFKEPSAGSVPLQEGESAEMGEAAGGVSDTQRALDIEDLLPKHRTVFFIGLEGLPQFFDAFLRPIRSEVKGDNVPDFLIDDEWTRRVGFTPQDPELWSQLGMDQNRGIYWARIHLNRDFRRLQSSIFFLPTVHIEPVLSLLNAWGITTALTPSAGAGLQHLTVGSRMYLLGRRDGYTALLLLPNNATSETVEDLAPLFVQFLKDSKPRLSTHSVLNEDVKAESSSVGLVGALSMETWARQLKVRGRLNEVWEAILAQLPAGRLVTGAQGSVLRMMTSSAFSEALHKIFSVSSPPELSQYVPRSGWSAVRLSLNLPTLLSGLSESLPSSMTKQKFFLMGLPTVMKIRGIPFDEGVKGLEGHVLLQVPTSSLSQAVRERPMFGSRFVYVATVKNPAMADHFLRKIRKNVLETPDRSVADLSLEGHSGTSWRTGERNFHLIRVDQAIFFATHLEDLKHIMNLSPSESLAGTPAGKTFDHSQFIFAVQSAVKDLHSKMADAPLFLRVWLPKLGIQTLGIRLTQGLSAQLIGPHPKQALSVLALWPLID